MSVSLLCVCVLWGGGLKYIVFALYSVVFKTYKNIWLTRRFSFNQIELACYDEQHKGLFSHGQSERKKPPSRANVGSTWVLL